MSLRQVCALVSLFFVYAYAKHEPESWVNVAWPGSLVMEERFCRYYIWARRAMHGRYVVADSKYTLGNSALCVPPH